MWWKKRIVGKIDKSWRITVFFINISARIRAPSSRMSLFPKSRLRIVYIRIFALISYVCDEWIKVTVLFCNTLLKYSIPSALIWLPVSWSVTSVLFAKQNKSTLYSNKKLPSYIAILQPDILCPYHQFHYLPEKYDELPIQ
jgi:hypothetical protein